MGLLNPKLLPIFIDSLAESVAKAASISDDSQCKMNRAEVITTLMISALYYQCHDVMTRHVVKQMGYFDALISSSRIVRRIHQA